MDKAVATQYSGVDKQRGSVFEIVPGRIDIGAELSWLSQYPGEAEYLFPPLSCLEVIDEPHVQGQVVVFPLRVNINLKGLTLEQLEERRKVLHMAMADNLREELGFEAAELIDKYQIQAVILNCVDENDKPLIEALILHMKSFVLEGKEKFYNFELMQDHDRYILSAQIQGNEIAENELNSIQVFSGNNVSVLSSNAKLYVRAFVLRGNANNTAINRKFREDSLHEELSKAILFVKKEYSLFLHTHRDIPASDFNTDEKYKELTKEAIEAKALGMKKIKYYIGERTSPHSADSSLLERILSTPFRDFSSESIGLELESGVFDFPWRDVVEQKETIDLKAWNPISLATWQLDKVCTTIANHTKWVRAWVNGHLIEFPGGMMAQDIMLEKPLPSECVPTVALLFSVNTNLARLRIGATGNNLGAAEWGHIAGAVKGHPNLQDLADFEW
eukprot:CAMPEP_0172208590 /NCGR_PEP_ID=MMETSP1050-20130122/34565_1 /TAXON_ID=233186 /ORGANISM="Cryptomonas curvata, Strain CCAP979/52" /LENGTH=445 /DNA_ID=CAMNT_0012888215 /DNA_START=1008 /DNA_END=2342 /DNA_ORIENTATION=-